MSHPNDLGACLAASAHCNQSIALLQDDEEPSGIPRDLQESQRTPSPLGVPFEGDGAVLKERGSLWRGSSWGRSSWRSHFWKLVWEEERSFKRGRGFLRGPFRGRGVLLVGVS